MAKGVTVKVSGDVSNLKTSMDEAAKKVKGLGDEAEKTNNTSKGLGDIDKKFKWNNVMQATEQLQGVGDGLIEFGKHSIESAAHMNAMDAQFEQVFGNMGDKAQASIDKMADSFGMLPNRIKPLYTQLTSMFKGLGMSQEESMVQAEKATNIAADAAAFYDKSLEEASGAMTSFVKGNYEGGESIGLFANDTQMAAFAVKNDLIPATDGAKEASEKSMIAVEKAQKKLSDAYAKHGEDSIEAREAAMKLKEAQESVAEELAPQTQKWADLDEATKQAVRVEYAKQMQEMAGATGQASRESGEYENQMGNVQQAMEEFYAQIGQDILPTFLDILKDLTGVLKKVGDVWSKLDQPSKDFIIALGAMIALLTTIAPLIVAFMAIGSAAAPIMAVVAAIAAIIAIVKNWGLVTDWISEKWDAFVSWISDLWDGLKQSSSEVWDSIKEGAGELWEGVKSKWSDFTEWVSDLWDGLVDWFSGVWDRMVEGATDIWDGVKDTWSGMTEWFSEFWDGLVEGAVNIWDGVKDTWQTFIDWVSGIWEGVKEVWSIVWADIVGIVKIPWDIMVALIQYAFDLIAGTFDTMGQILKGLWELIWNPIGDFLREVWEAITTYVSETWNNIVAKAHEIFDPIVEWFGTIWDNIKNTLTDTWNTVIDFLTNTWNTISDTAKAIWEPVKEFFINTMQGISDKISEIWGNITSWLSDKWNAISQMATDLWNKIKATVINKIQETKAKLQEIWEAVSGWLSDKWNGIKNKASEIWNAMKDAISNKVTETKNKVTELWEGAKNAISEKWESIKAKASELWENMKNAITGKVEDTKSAVVGKWEDIKESVMGVWNGLKDKVGGIWDGITSKIKGAVDKCKEIVNNIFGGLNVKPPHIPMPHFSLKGSFNPLKGKIPSVGVNWYAKGGMFDSPSVIGVGEAGKEAVLPLKKSVLSNIGDRIMAASNMNRPERQMAATSSTSSNVFNITVQGDANESNLRQLTQDIVKEISSQRQVEESAWS